MQTYIKHFKLSPYDVERLMRIGRLATSVAHFDRMLIAQVEWHKSTEASTAMAPKFSIHDGLMDLDRWGL